MTARTRTRSTPPAPAVSSAPRPTAKGVLQELAKEATKKHGEGVFVPAAEAFKYIRHIPFDHLIGDLATLGGLPEGRAAMFLGREGGGKTTQAMRLVASAQRKYPEHSALWVDTELTFDPLWAVQHGVDLDRLQLISTVTGEDAADLICAAKANAEELCMIVVDSVNQMIPMKEYQESIGDTQVALQPRLMGRLCSHLTGAAAERRVKRFQVPVTEIFINQYRTKIGGVQPQFANKEIPGGKQLKHYTSTHIEFKSKINVETDESGNKTPYIVEHVFNLTRAKGPSSLRTGEYSVVVGPDHNLPIGSYDEAGTILSQAKKIGLWTGGGTAQRFEGFEPTFRKMDEGRDWLEDNPDAAVQIKRLIIAHQRKRVGLQELPYDRYLLDWC